LIRNSIKKIFKF